MKILQSVWNDVRRGENIETYLVILLVFAIGLANLVGWSIPSNWIASITLAALGILAIAAPKSERRMEGLAQKLAESTNTLFLEEFPAIINNDFAEATEVWMIGVTLTRTVRTYYSTIEKKLQKGQTIRVLLVHPEGAAVEMAETRVYGRSNVERIKAEIRGILGDLCDLCSTTSGKLEIRTVRNPLTFGAMVMNPDSESGILYLEHYPFKIEGGSKPKLVLRWQDGRWYKFYRDELRTLWDNSQDWDCIE